MGGGGGVRFRCPGRQMKVTSEDFDFLRTTNNYDFFKLIIFVSGDHCDYSTWAPKNSAAILLTLFSSKWLLQGS
jgi:hypothetical protein